MPTGLIYNPAAVDGLNATVGNLTIEAVNGDTVGLSLGQLVEVVTPFTGPSSPPYTGASSPFQVKRSATAVDFLLLGVVSGPLSAGQTSFAVGSVVEVTVSGLAQVLMDGATTAGQVVIQSTTTAGEGHSDATAVTGQTIGAVLQSIAAAGLAWALVGKS